MELKLTDTMSRREIRHHTYPSISLHFQYPNQALVVTIAVPKKLTRETRGG